MYLCHSENLMPKDTKSLGNNKAPACESWGFVLKKKKVRILTHLLKFKLLLVLAIHYNIFHTNIVKSIFIPLGKFSFDLYIFK